MKRSDGYCHSVSNVNIELFEKSKVTVVKLLTEKKWGRVHMGFLEHIHVC